MKKLKAFTLLELLIGMIISSIVIGFGYAAYSLIYKQYLGYKQVKEKITELTLLNQLLTNDIANAEVIAADDNTISLFRKDQYTLEYRFADTLLLRTENELTDTFKVWPAHIKTGFLFPERKLFVHQFSFDVQLLHEQEHFSFTKDYSAETLMKYEPLVKMH